MVADVGDMPLSVESEMETNDAQILPAPGIGKVPGKLDKGIVKNGGIT